MCQDLTDELNTGKRLATELVLHLQAMGAANATIPVQVAAESYRVTVETVDSPAAAAEKATSVCACISAERLTESVCLIDGKHYRLMPDQETADFIWGS